jgi:AcrR family transcriptional regulator
MEASASGRAQAGRTGIAERLWDAARSEFSQRGYHGARVQGIARRAGCNVALLYRHWASKKALYLDVLGSAWCSILSDVTRLLDREESAPGVVAAYLDANLRDPVGAQILIREVLDGGPSLALLLEREPSLVDPVRRAARVFDSPSVNGAPTTTLHPRPAATMAVLSIGGLASLVAAAQEAARPFLGQTVSSDEWRQHAYSLLLHGVATRTV